MDYPFRVDMKAKVEPIGETWLVAMYFSDELEAGQYIAESDSRTELRIVDTRKETAC